MGLKITKTKKAVSIELKIPIAPYKGAGVAIFRKVGTSAQVLLGKRAYKPFSGRWTFIGGEAENKEKYHETALREFKEEIGVSLLGRFISKIGKVSTNLPFFKWTTLILESSQPIRIVKRKNGLIGGEFTDVQWVDIEDLSNYKLHWFVMKVIDFYKKGGLVDYKTRCVLKPVR
ncbi:MAG: NUDIX hydrolase [Bacteroidales bacterium]